MSQVTHLTLERVAKRYRDRDPSRLVDFLRTNCEEEHVMGELVERLIREIEKSEKKGVKRYELAKRAGIQQSSLSRFVNRQESMKLEMLEKLCGALELQIVLTPSRKRPTGKKPKPRG
ncbi:MAG: helix-turn-helix domain-containing protein [Thermoanaerobaculia bacterium]